MSRENVEIVRHAAKALSESYASGEPTDELLALCAPDIRIDASRRVFNPAGYDGHAGLRSAIREIWDAWEDFCEENERLIDAGDKVLALQTIAGRGRASGVEVRAPGALIWTFRNGRVVHIDVFLDQREAFTAVGLEEHAVTVENVETVRRFYAAADQMAAFAEMCASDVVIDLTALFLDQPLIHGREEGLAYLETTPWGSLRFDPERFFHVDDERVLVFSRTIQTGRASGVTLETRGAQEFTLREGLIVRYKVYPDRAEALKAVGIEE